MELLCIGVHLELDRLVGEVRNPKHIHLHSCGSVFRQFTENLGPLLLLGQLALFVGFLVFPWLQQ